MCDACVMCVGDVMCVMCLCRERESREHGCMLERDVCESCGGSVCVVCVCEMCVCV